MTSIPYSRTKVRITELQVTFSPGEYVYTKPDLPREPLYVPLAQTFDIFNHDLESIEVESSDSIEGNIKQNQRPFEERVGGICYEQSAKQIQVE